MKIAGLIHSVSTGGAERLAASAVNWWAGAGHDVSLVTFDNGEQDAFWIRNDVQRHNLQIPAGVRGLAFKNIARVLALRKLLLEKKFDACVAFASIPSAVLGLARGRLPVRAIGRLENHPPRILTGGIRTQVMWRAFGNLDFVVAQTERSADWVRRRAGSIRVQTIPNPAFYPLANAQPLVDPRASYPANSKIVLGVGRLEPQKRFDRLIKAFAHAAKGRPEWVLAILGDGQLRDDLETLTKQLGLGARVKLLGRAGNMRDWYDAASLFVLSSDFEGFPNSLVEAMSHGVPSIAVDCETGPREIIRDNVDGFLANQSVEALAEKLVTAMSLGPRLQVIGQNALSIRERLSPEVVFAKWNELLSGELA